MSTQEERLALAGYWMEKADESLRAAGVLLEAGITGASMSRLYYAVFYAASALFAAKDIQYGKHSAVQAAVHRDLVKPGIITKEMGALYDRMFNARQEGDYKAFTVFSNDDVAGELAKVERFVQYFHTLVATEMALFPL